jgi:hypothetical protein
MSREHPPLSHRPPPPSGDPPLSRRHALALLVGGLAADACGASRDGASAAAGAPGRNASAGDAFKFDRASELVPAAGLVWLVELAPRDLVDDPILGPAVATIIPGPGFDAFAQRHGGLDLRLAQNLVLASYPKTTLVVARLPFDQERVEAAFVRRWGAVEGRAVEHGMTRVWRGDKGVHEQVALLAREAVVFERGEPGPLRAAIYFSQGRLRRSLPALAAEPLASAAALTGAAPLRAFAPGPFEGEWANGLAGLLRAATAVAVAVRPVAHPPNGAIAMRLLLTGAWGQDAPAAAERLRSAFGVLADDPLGRLTGLDHPLSGPTVTADAGALRLDATFDALVAARGIHTVGDASVAEIMAY